MKSDAERQREYQKRRKSTAKRLTVWVSHETLRAVDAARGDAHRAAWIGRVILEAVKERADGNFW